MKPASAADPPAGAPAGTDENAHEAKLVGVVPQPDNSQRRFQGDRIAYRSNEKAGAAAAGGW